MSEQTFNEQGEPLKVVQVGNATITTIDLPVTILEPRLITRLAFEKRFTDAEAIGIDMASRAETVEAATLRRFLSLAQAAKFIDLDDPDLATGLGLLEQFGLLASGRADVIVSAPISANERP